jgi:hypothetical protein
LFSLEIKVEGFLTTDSNGRKAYTKGSVIKWDVEIGSFTVDLLMQSLSNQFKWSSSHIPCVWFFDKKMGEDVRLFNDFQLNDLFEMYKDQMHCEVVVGVFERTIADVDEFDNLEPLVVIPPVENEDVDPNYASAAAEPDAAAAAPDASAAKPDAAAEPNVAAAESEAAAAEPELEPDREPDMFDNEEEYVGVDDETMYMPVPRHQFTNNAHAANNSAAAEPDADACAAEGGIPLEAEVDDADPQEVNVIHDPENPKIVKGGQFPDIVSFRKAIRHHAVKVGFEFADLVTDKTRFIAKCKAEGCPWRIHASRIYDGKTIEVCMQPIHYDCSFDLLCMQPMPYFCLCRSKD